MGKLTTGAHHAALKQPLRFPRLRGDDDKELWPFPTIGWIYQTIFYEEMKFGIFVLLTLKPGDAHYKVTITDSPQVWLSKQNEGIDPAFHTSIWYIDDHIYPSAIEAKQRKAELEQMSNDQLTAFIKSRNAELKPIQPPRSNW